MIKEINLFEYLKDFEGLRTALSDFYIRTKDCNVLGAYENGEAVGLLLCEMRNVREILVLCTKNDDVAVKNQLLKTFLATIPSQTAVRWRILNDCLSQNTQLAVSFGFTAESILHIFHCGRSNFDAVQGVIDKYTPCYARMERQGYVTKPFDDLTEDELHQIRDNPDGEFESFLQSDEHIAGKTGKLDGKCSFATVLNGKVFAYTVVVAPDDKRCIVENTSVARSAKRGGTYILPFLNTIIAIKDSNYDAMSFAIYETNADALPLMRKHFSPLFTSETEQRNYILIKR